MEVALHRKAPYDVVPSRRSGEIGIRTRLKIWRGSLLMSVRVRPPAPSASLLVFRLFSRQVRGRRIMDNQLEVTLPVFFIDEDLIDNGVLAVGANLRRQENVAHGDANRSVSLNGSFTLDEVVVPCTYPIQLNEAFIPGKLLEIFADEVGECSGPRRSEVLWRQC